AQFVGRDAPQFELPVDGFPVRLPPCIRNTICIAIWNPHTTANRQHFRVMPCPTRALFTRRGETSDRESPLRLKPENSFERKSTTSGQPRRKPAQRNRRLPSACRRRAARE